MISLIIACILLGIGCFTLLVSLLGVFNFNYVMNRMQCAAIIDSIGFLLIVAGLMVGNFDLAYVPKLALLVAFQYISSPIASHMVARLEIETDDEIEKHMKKEEE